MDWGPRITYLASTAYRERVVPFGIKDADRQKHVCVVGNTVSERASLLARMALQDIERGLGTVILDASGSLSPLILERLSPDELTRLVYVDVADAEYPFSWHSAHEFRTAPRGRELFSDALASLYGVSRSGLSDFLASWVLSDESRTVLSPYAVLADEHERTRAFPDEHTRAEFTQLLEAHAMDVQTWLENGRFLTKDTVVRNVLGQRTHKVTFETLAEGAIIVFDLSRVRIFPTRCAPVVRLAVYALRAWSHVDSATTLYMHDCLRYLTNDDAVALFTDNHYALTLSDTLYREADLPLREKALAHCGSVLAFAPHEADIPLVHQLYAPYVSQDELKNLESGESCVLLTIDAARARPFFAHTLALPERKNVSLQDVLIDSRKKYTLPRVQVDEQFKKVLEDDEPKNPPPFNDAFKSIFAKRDPARALEMTGDKKPERSVPPKDPPPPTTPPASTVTREVPEPELRDLLYVTPIAV